MLHGGPITISPYSVTGRCPICGALGACPDGAPVPVTNPVDPDGSPVVAVNGPLRAYRVELGYATATLLLNDADAAGYGPAAVLL